VFDSCAELEQLDRQLEHTYLVSQLEIKNLSRLKIPLHLMVQRLKITGCPRIETEELRSGEQFEMTAPTKKCTQTIPVVNPELS